MEEDDDDYFYDDLAISEEYSIRDFDLPLQEEEDDLDENSAANKIPYVQYSQKHPILRSDSYIEKRLFGNRLHIH